MKPNMILHKGAVAKLQSTGRLATAPWGRLHKEGEVLVDLIFQVMDGFFPRLCGRGG